MQLLDSDEFLFCFDCGVCQPSTSLTLKDKEAIISSIAMHCCIYSCKVELDEIKRGLSSLGFLELMSQNPFLRSLFECRSIELTADHLQDILVPTFSPVGSNLRLSEEATMMMLLELLHEIEVLYDYI